MLHSICQQIWKTQQWLQDWKRSVFIPIPRKGNAKEYSNYCTIAPISHASKVMLKILQARLQQYVNQELPDVQVRFRKGRDQMVNICWIIEKAKEFQKNICFTEYTKAFDCVDHNKLENSSKRWEYQTTLLVPGETFMWVKKQQLEPESSKLRKYVKAVYCHSAYLTYMQSTSWETLGWKKHKLESRLPEEISITSDMQMTHPNGRKQRGAKEPLDEGERAEWKMWLKTQHSKD